MSDAIDFYRDMKAYKQEKRAGNRESSASMLQAAGIPFVSKNNGAHLVIVQQTLTVDFWPGTGLWMIRGNDHKRRGVRGLIGFIKARNK